MAEEEKAPNNYFNMSDGQFCHVLPDRIVIYPKLTIVDMPVPRDGVSPASLILFTLIAVIGAVLTVCFSIVGFYPLAVMTLMACVASSIALIRTSKYSATNCILRDSIMQVEYKVVNYGYDYFLVHYVGANGKTYLRRIGIYDSAEITRKAVELMLREGLLNVPQTV